MKPPLPIPIASVDDVRWRPAERRQAPVTRHAGPADPKEVYRAAHLLVRQYGPDAAAVATRRREALMAGGDIFGMATWRLIQRTVEELCRTNRGPTEPVH